MNRSEPAEPMALREVLEALRSAIGEIAPWPADSETEYVSGAILVQNTAWTNVERSLGALRASTGFEPERLLGLTGGELEALIRPSGFMTAKARALRAWCGWRLSGQGAGAAELGDEELREALLGLPGIGPETADVIALMVFSRRRFIFDAYGRRALGQAGYAVPGQYERARRALEARFEGEGLSHAELVEVHGLLLEAGKRARARGGWETYGPTIGIVPRPSPRAGRAGAGTDAAERRRPGMAD